MANPYSFTQIATILNTIVAGAQGRNANPLDTPVDTSQFVALAQRGLTCGSDALTRSMTALIARTIFSIRPYMGGITLLEADDVDWGFVVRKLTPIVDPDSAQENPEQQDSPKNGESVDQWKMKLPQTLETSFTSAVQWCVQGPSIHTNAMRMSLRGPAEYGQWLGSQFTATQNLINQQKTALGHGTVCNFAGAKIAAANADNSPVHVVHCLTEYNTLTGKALTATTVFQPENFADFVGWLCARIQTASDLMSRNLTVMHHQQAGGESAGKLLRITPKADQRMLFYAPFENMIQKMVLPWTFNENFLKLVPHDSLDFWQDVKQGAGINVTPTMLNSEGSAVKGAAVSAPYMLGVLYDRWAMGYSIVNDGDGVEMTPINARGRYYNTFWHFWRRYWNDTTENGVVFLLD